jgi:hypothetical protein
MDWAGTRPAGAGAGAALDGAAAAAWGGAATVGGAMLTASGLGSGRSRCKGGVRQQVGPRPGRSSARKVATCGLPGWPQRTPACTWRRWTTRLHARSTRPEPRGKPWATKRG